MRIKSMIMIILFIPIQAFSSSYMICVNPNDLNDWKWAPPITDQINEFFENETIPISSEGTFPNNRGIFLSSSAKVYRVQLESNLINATLIYLQK